MAVGRSREFFEDLQPPGPGFFAAHGQFERGFAARAAPHGGAREQPPAQRAQLAALKLAQPISFGSASAAGRWQGLIPLRV